MTLVAVAAAITVAGCGGDDEKTADVRSAPDGARSTTTAPPATSESQQPAPEGHDGQGGGAATGTTESSAPQVAPGRGCLRGGYVSSSFVGRRSFDSPFGPLELSGRGRGLALELTGSRWTMRGVGRRPMRGTAMGIQGTLKVDGSARGRLERARGERLRFRQTGSHGSVTLAGLGQTFEVPVSVVAPAVVPDGRATVTCSGDRLTIDSASGVLRLTRR